jgi:hypothetical protein
MLAELFAKENVMDRSHVDIVMEWWDGPVPHRMKVLIAGKHSQVQA